ncbi:MAG: YbaN family protein [Bacteroidota bacterium]
MNNRSIVNYLLIALGWICVVMGIIGIFVPVWPTTVFFLIAAWSFAKSSERFYSWLINHQKFGRFIRDYREHRGMQLKSKIIAVTMITFVIGSSAIFFTGELWLRIILVVIAAGVIWYILSLNTINKTVTTSD